MLVFIKKLLRYLQRKVIYCRDALLVRVLVLYTEVRWRRRRPGKRHGLSAELVISLTSYPERFSTLPLTLKCLLTQSIAPDRVLLWIAQDDECKLTDEILNFCQHGLTIEVCEDLRSYKKVIPTLREFPDAFVVTADDDLYYWTRWLEELVGSFQNNYSEVVCHRAHRIRFGLDGLPLPYIDWEWETVRSEASLLNFPTSGLGALYPPKVFHHDVAKASTFKEICPDSDDAWLYWMMRLNGAVARKIGPRRRIIFWPDSQKFALFHSNLVGGQNDEQIKRLIRLYGFPSVGS